LSIRLAATPALRKHIPDDVDRPTSKTSKCHRPGFADPDHAYDLLSAVKLYATNLVMFTRRIFLSGKTLSKKTRLTALLQCAFAHPAESCVV
jgi:hypothetical protein